MHELFFVNSIIKYLLKQILLKVFAWSYIVLYQHHVWTKECETLAVLSFGYRSQMMDQ